MVDLHNFTVVLWYYYGRITGNRGTSPAEIRLKPLSHCHVSPRVHVTIGHDSETFEIRGQSCCSPRFDFCVRTLYAIALRQYVLTTYLKRMYYVCSTLLTCKSPVFATPALQVFFTHQYHPTVARVVLRCTTLALRLAKVVPSWFYDHSVVL